MRSIYKLPKRASTHIIRVSRCELLSLCSIDVIKHFIEQNNFTLELVELCHRLRAVVGLCVGVRASEGLHQLLRSRQVPRSASPDEFLQFSRLRLSIFRLKLVGRFNVLYRHMNARDRHEPEQTHHRRGCLLTAENIPKAIPFERKKPVHIFDIPQILLPARLGADTLLPSMNELQNPRHDWAGEGRWAFRESTDELVQKFFGGNLEVEWVAARLDEGVEKCECEDGDMRVSVVCKTCYEHRCITGANSTSELVVSRAGSTDVLAFFVLISSAISR